MKPLLTDINPRLLLAEQLWDLREQYSIFGHSRFGLDLFWQLVNASASPYSLSIKPLNADGMAVPSALRKTLRKLEHEGWIRIDSHPDDQRV